ncbi:MAG TPA: hypothetical protein VGC89_00870 [Pyrinomonadaceae bacterium]|jgi:hypothetical protein
MKIEPPKEGTPFEKNLFYERLIEMRRTRRKDFDTMSPATHLALGAYEQAKSEHEQRIGLTNGGV